MIIFNLKAENFTLNKIIKNLLFQIFNMELVTAKKIKKNNSFKSDFRRYIVHTNQKLFALIFITN